SCEFCARPGMALHQSRGGSDPDLNGARRRPEKDRGLLMASSAPTSEVVDLVQQLIRNECVNDGTPGSGGEVRNADLLEAYLAGAGLDVERFDSAPGRSNLIARIEGSDPDAPTLCLLGHTDVVP